MNSSRIFLFTLFIHLGWFVLFSSGGWHKSPPLKEKMRVITKEFTPPKPITKIVKPTAPIIQAALPPQKIVTKKKPPEKKKVAIKKKKAPPSSKQLLKKLDQNLKKIEPPKVVTETATAIETVTEDDSPPTFFDRVALIFQETLTLPEKGAVKLTISVQPNGKIVIIDLIQSESETNLQYLKLMLPLITLPPPDGGKEQTFMITFCND